MSAPTDLSQTITDAAATPQSASVDGQSASARSIADVILADQYTAAKYAAGLKNRGIRFSKMLPAGPVSDQGGSNGVGGFNSANGGLT